MQLPINTYLTSSGEYVPVPMLRAEEALDIHRARVLQSQDYPHLNPDAKLLVQLELSVAGMRVARSSR
jgi:hypothetical protein